VVPCWINSIISTPFLSQRTVAISFLADIICLNFLGLFGECVCTSTAVTTFWFQHSQVKPPPPPITMWLRN
jgi:hypothetical protein